MQPDDVARRSHGPSLARRQGLITGEERFLAELERRIDPRNFECWFRNKVVVRVVGARLTLQVARKFLVEWLQRHFRRQILAAACAVLGDSAEVTFAVDAPAASVPAETPAAGESSASPQKAAPQAEVPPPQAPAARSYPRTIERRLAGLADFVPGPDEENQVPLLVAARIAAAPGEGHNPLLLHGSTGCGKTHLLEGIYREVRRRHPALRVQYLSAESFTNHFTHAMLKKTGAQFRQRFRTVDVLLLDNVEFFQGKEKTQWELLHTFDELVRHGRQVVLTADRHPRLLTGLCEPLASRFGSGLACKVQVPGPETRFEIARRHAERMNARIKPEALRYAAGRFEHNVRDLIGAMICLATHFEVTRRPVTVSAARRLLAEQEPRPPRILSAAEIERAVCEFFHVSPAELRSPRRSRCVAQPRMVAMFLIRKHTGKAYKEIGAQFGGRNHATVIAAERRVRQWLQGECLVQVAADRWPLAEVVQAIESRLAG